MKISVTKTEVEVEADPDEIRQALPSILGLDHAEATAIESGTAPVVKVIEAGKPAYHRATASAELAADLEDAIWDAAGLEQGSPTPLAPFTAREDIPADRLMWNSTKMVAHVAIEANDPTRVYCPAKLVRVIGGDPVIAAPEVCKSCNRQIEIAARKVRR